MPLPLAANFDDIIPVIAVVFFFMIPIVAIMAWHQQRMAMLVRNNAPEQLQGQTPPLPNHSMTSNDVMAIRHEIQQLKDVVNSLAINVDNMNDRITRQNELSDRMKVGE